VLSHDFGCLEDLELKSGTIVVIMSLGVLVTTHNANKLPKGVYMC
jgi:hypothetical protein